MIPAKYWSPTKKLMVLGAMAGGKLVEDTATGNPLTFFTDKAKPLKSLLVPFLPVQSGSGDPSPSNIRPIVAWDGVKVWNGGKNLFNGTNVINGYFSTQGSDTIIYSASEGRTVWCPCKPDTVYAVSKMTGGKRLSVYTSEEEPKVNTVVYATQRVSGSGNDVFVFRTPSNAKYICAFVWFSSADTEITAEQMISSVQIEAGQTATAYEPFVPIAETDIVFPSPVYGGTLEAVSGKLMDAYIMRTFHWSDGQNPNDRGDVTRKMFSLNADVADANPYDLCNVAKYKGDYYSNDVHFYVNGTNKAAFVFLPNDTPEETEITVVAKLATPQEITLTPEQITAIKGNNTIWSDANGEMTAVYLKKG